MEQETIPATGEAGSNVGVKSTKQEILEAYRALVKRHRREAPAEEPQRAQQRKEEDRTLAEHAALQNTGDVAAAIGQARTATQRAFDDIQRQAEERFRTLQSLRDATRIQEARLKEWYDVERAAQELVALLRAREEQERANALTEQQRKEQRKREEDAYQYEMEQRERRDDEKRRQKQLEFDAGLRAREEALAKRETAAVERDVEFTRLQERVAALPKELEDAKRTVREETEARERADAATKTLIARKEAEAAQVVAQANIANLQQTIARQQEQTAALQEQLKATLAQVQEVTLKTIEGTSDKRALQAVNQYAAQQARDGAGRSYRPPPDGR